MIREKDIAIWNAAKPFLDVRMNDEHTLHSYVIGQQLANIEPNADPDIILPAIILHDTGWKKIPQDKILQVPPVARRLHRIRNHATHCVDIGHKRIAPCGNILLPISPPPHHHR